MVERRLKHDRANLERAVRAIEQRIVDAQRQQANLEEQRIQFEKRIAAQDEQIEQGIAGLKERKRQIEVQINNLER